MAKCPQCNQEIDHLLERQKVLDCFIVRLDGSGGDLEYRDQLDSDSLDDDSIFWECPECFEWVADTKDKAISILVGKGKENL